MFVFAGWDPTTHSLFRTRDPLGQQPLYLAVMPSSDGHGIGAVAFASELAALRQVPWVDATTDDAAIGHYLRFGYIPAPLTIYRGCEKLPPARWMRVTAKGLEVQQYFDPNTPAAASLAPSRESR